MATATAVPTGQQPLAGSAHQALSLGGASYGESGIVKHYENEHFLIGHISIPVTIDTLEEQALSIYDVILKAIGPRSLCRMWNYIPQINKHGTQNIEAYKLFCSGRSRAFSNRYGADCSDRFPAASATGCNGNLLTIVFISSLLSVRHGENPQQTPAYHYPEKYGPRSPSFARISRVLDSTQKEWLFISGTAAIKGYESQFIGDLDSQVAMTFENIDLTLASSDLPMMDDWMDRRRHFHVYLRNATDLKRLLVGLQKKLKPSDTYSVVEADICRADLNVEIELTISPEDPVV
ncbi:MULTISPECIES: hypothetical protein [unclassified Lentimonas]|uniref:chorismate transformation enzyme, FkbO/Hyg5 family n=1 Tax=unclassified Lentimonas TaxID=2630993 RepID=UPI001322F8BB|nr:MULTISPECIES: hypothetical protein [unclassified Lentimonas]CAA6679604.1 Unannotated [Lentimonas sp. CC4]CAA6687322.1 Unannotated [Lentimonas sp. CC6]CAA7077217.1 Unannotated [Lentimonas sp. CC4]CAA7171764.1 Unannotated [Lentimonas sp. CC21]CAA7183567.1 Unannotated [Lentimonas sp. CC8]